MKKLIYSLFLSLIFVSCQHTEKAASGEGGYIPSSEIKQPRDLAEAKGKTYALSTQGLFTTKIADEVLRKKGNLIDAFVAASFAISVERPQSTGIGGGGFLVYYDARTKKAVAVDFRERAPTRSTRDMYLDQNKNFVPALSQDGALAVGTPGLVKGLWEVHKKYGKLQWKDLVMPAAKLAREGFAIYPDLHEALEDREAVLAQNADAKKIFLSEKGKALPVGHILKQEDLAKTLELIAAEGPTVFYSGSIAQKIAEFSFSHKGILSKKDLNDYKVKWRKPIEGEVLGYKFYSMPPPSSGGIHVFQFLKMLENEKWALKDLNTAEVIHTQAAAFQSAFADRAAHLGDPDFYKVPQKELLDSKYIAKRRSLIPRARARKAEEVFAGDFKVKKESSETTHMSMMDSDGNAISSTQTINGWMGAGVVVTGTGILLNNEMDDFSAKPGTANLYGAVGGEANAIAPLKTPLSSMSPTLLLDKNKTPVMAVGAPGGTRIISCTALTIYNHLFFKLPLWESVTNIRIHQQWRPDVLSIEPPGPEKKELLALKNYGYETALEPAICKVMGVSKEGDTFTAVADPRDIGTSLAR